jgi:hypothetical protein
MNNFIICWADCQPHKSGDLYGQATKFSAQQMEENMVTIFDTMTVDEAINYCYKHQKEYDRDVGRREFDCLIAILEDGTIKPSQLPEYGMDYESAENAQQQV